MRNINYSKNYKLWENFQLAYLHSSRFPMKECRKKNSGLG